MNDLISSYIIVLNDNLLNIRNTWGTLSAMAAKKSYTFFETLHLVDNLASAEKKRELLTKDRVSNIFSYLRRPTSDMVTEIGKKKNK